MADEQTLPTVNLVENPVPTEVPAGESTPPTPQMTPPQLKMPSLSLENELMEEDSSLWQKTLRFFRSTFGKILLFTALFLFIAAYILTTSNVVLFQGQFSRGVETFDTFNETAVSTENITQTPTAEDIGTTRSINNNANPFIGASGDTAQPEGSRSTSPVVDTSITAINADRNGTVIERSPSTIDSTILDTSLRNQIASSGSIINPGVDDGAAAPVLPPATPTGLTATCSPDNSLATLRWMPVSGATYQLRIDNAKNTWIKEGSAAQKNEGDIIEDDLALTVYSFKPELGQEYKWWMYTNANNLQSAQAVGPAFTCGTKPLELATITGVYPSGSQINPIDTTSQITAINPNPAGSVYTMTPALCGNDEYYVTDSDPAKSGCKKIPTYQGATAQSDFICGFYATILSDPVGYRINEFTKATLQTGVNSQCKSSTVVQPTKINTTPTAQYCPNGQYLSGTQIPADCKTLPSITGLTGDSLKLACSQLKSLYDQGPTLKINNDTFMGLLSVVNGPLCSPQSPVSNTVTGTNAPDTTSETDANVSENTQTNVVTGAPKVTQTSGKLVALNNQEFGSVVPQHPVAGKKPHRSAETGPEIWIYGVGALGSYFSMRRKHISKK